MYQRVIPFVSFVSRSIRVWLILWDTDTAKANSFPALRQFEPAATNHSHTILYLLRCSDLARQTGDSYFESCELSLNNCPYMVSFSQVARKVLLLNLSLDLKSSSAFGKIAEAHWWRNRRLSSWYLPQVNQQRVASPKGMRMRSRQTTLLTSELFGGVQASRSCSQKFSTPSIKFIALRAQAQDVEISASFQANIKSKLFRIMLWLVWFGLAQKQVSTRSRRRVAWWWSYFSVGIASWNMRMSTCLNCSTTIARKSIIPARSVEFSLV